MISVILRARFPAETETTQGRLVVTAAVDNNLTVRTYVQSMTELLRTCVR